MISALKRLEGLGRLKNNWYSVASTVDEVIVTNGWATGQVATSDWLSKAAEAVGVTENTITRMLAVREFLNAISGPEGPKRWGDPDQFPISALEILKRIHAVDPAEALALLERVLRGELTLRQLNELHEAIITRKGEGRSSSRALTKRASTAFFKSALEAIKTDLHQFGCPREFALREPPPRYPFFDKVSMIAFDPGDILGTIVGFDIYFVERSKGPQLRRMPGLLPYTAYISSFFKRYVLVLPSTADQESLREMLDALPHAGHTNVDAALLHVDESTGTTTVEMLNYSSPASEPVPDCRALAGWNTMYEMAARGSRRLRQRRG